MGRAGTCVDYNLSVPFCDAKVGTDFDYLISRDGTRVVQQVKQFSFQVSDRPGLLAEIASALWQKGIKIQAFSAELHEGQGTFHLVVDKVAVAKKTFVENGWEAAEEDVQQHRNRKIFAPH